MPDQSAETARIAVAAQCRFGLHLLRDTVNRKPRQNVFLSPLSVFLALHMTENGSAGTTRTAMRKALEFPDLEAPALNASSAALQEMLKHDSATLTTANALWADRHFNLDPQYVKQCAALFHAHASALNFQDSHAAAEINDWVKTATNGKIATIVTPDVVAKAAVILTNAVYFAGKWHSEFARAQTQDAAFHLSGGGTRMVPMMHHAHLTGAYRAGANYDGAILFYKESSIFFGALLPQAGHTPQDVLGSLDVEHLAAGSSEFDLELKLPRFTLDFSTSLSDSLKSMGMEVAFHYPQADFGPMGSRQFYISDVLHKTRLEVDEEGTVAAAASAVIMAAGAGMPRPRPVKTLVFDRPFVVFISDSRTGATLFSGVVEEP